MDARAQVGGKRRQSSIILRDAVLALDWFTHSLELTKLGSAVLEPDPHRLFAHVSSFTDLFSLVWRRVLVLVKLPKKILKHLA